ncbi:MAG: hypothetical protein K9G26_11760 [Emcibacter sp.]|nr:hypothetical protein [Emcibacter sp.]
MFIGHYAAGFALKSVEKKASLGMLFIAVQFVDILFFSFALLGIEKYRLIENFTAINHMDLYFYPYTHGLVSSFLWAGLIYGLWRYVPFFKKGGNGRLALVMAIGILSHWFLDFIVHIPDLPLIGDDSPKVGLGLWNSFMGTLVVEIALFAGAVLLYLRATKPADNSGFKGRYAMIIFAAFMGAFYIMSVNMPFDPAVTVTVTSITGLVLYGIFAALAFWLDRYRR